MALCGRNLNMTFAFQNKGHAELELARHGRLLPCRQCAKAAGIPWRAVPCTQEQFEASIAAILDLPVEAMHTERHLGSEPCDCEQRQCQGWALVDTEEGEQTCE